jgi:hypothetical protein
VPYTQTTITSNYPATLVNEAGSGACLLLNSDQNNTIFLGTDNTIQANDSERVVPLPPSGSVVVDGKFDDTYATCLANKPAVLYIIPGGVNFFLPVVSLTIPFGATTGERIVLDGVHGVILLYNSANQLVASYAPINGSDGKGSTYVGPGLAVYSGTGGSSSGLPYAFLSSNFEGLLGLFFPSNDTHEILASAINLQFNNAGTPQQKLITNVTGPVSSSRQDFVVIGLCASADDGSEFAAAFFEYHDASGNTYEHIVFDPTGLQMPFASQILGNRPGQSVPVSDTWHSLSPLASGFNITGNNFNGDACYCQYTYEPMGNFGSVHIRGNINVTAGPGLSTFKLLTGVGNGLPTIGYVPTQPRYFPVSFNFAAINGTNNPNMGMGVLETSGAIFVFGGAGSTINTALIFDAVIRLD